MLSRTAEHLFWIARYMERAETMARLLEVGYRMAMMPSTGAGYRNEWSSVLAAAGAAVGYAQRHGQDFDQDRVDDWLYFDRANPSSVASCIDAARSNARAIRTALTSEVWEALNSAWLELGQMAPDGSAPTLPDRCDWTKRHAAWVRGAVVGTLLQNDGHDFLSLGYALERADNTARLLDVKYYVLLPTTDGVGGAVDSYQWSTLLRALSAHRAFHWAYGGEYSPARIAQFLLLDERCPRSLRFCIGQADLHLRRLGRAYGQDSEALRQVDAVCRELERTDIEQVFDEGLHEFLTRFIRVNAELCSAIADSYLFGVH